MGVQINSIVYVRYIGNIVKNLKKLYFSFSEDEILFLKSMITLLDEDELLNKKFLNVFVKYRMVERDEEEKLVSSISSLSEEFDPYSIRIYVSIFEEISKFLNHNSFVSTIVKEQLESMVEELPNRIVEIDNIDKNAIIPERNKDNITIVENSIINGSQYSAVGNIVKIELSEDIEKCVQLAENAMIGPKHLGLMQSDVKDIISSTVSRELNMEMGFYNYDDKTGLEYYN